MLLSIYPVQLAVFESKSWSKNLAETGGFEPPAQFNPSPSLAVKSVRPLRHVSLRSHALPILGEFLFHMKSKVKLFQNDPKTWCFTVYQTVRPCEQVTCAAL